MTDQERWDIEKQAILGLLQSFVLLSLVGMPPGLGSYVMLMEKVAAANSLDDLFPQVQTNPLENVDTSNMDEELKKFFDKGE